MYIVAYLTLNSQQGDLPMLNALKKLFGIKPAEKQEQSAEVPYKVEAPITDYADIAIAQRSAPVAEKATEAMVESVAPAKKAPAKKAPAKKAPAAKKPRAPKAAK